MEWITFTKVPASAGTGEYLDYKPGSSPDRPLYVLSVETSHVDSSGAIRNTSQSITLRRGHAEALALKRGWTRASLIWQAKGRLPIYQPFYIRGSFSYADIGDTLQMKILIASREELV